MSDVVLQVPVAFRLCRRDDLRALEWMGLHGGARELIEATFAAQTRGIAAMLLADAGGFPVAQAWIDFGNRGSRQRPVIWAVRVFPPLQGSGLGRGLMQRSEELVAQRGAREVELGVEWHNARARQFYRRLGYRPVGARTDVERYEVEGYPREEEFRQEILVKTLPGADSRLEQEQFRPERTQLIR